MNTREINLFVWWLFIEGVDMNVIADALVRAGRYDDLYEAMKAVNEIIRCKGVK